MSLYNIIFGDNPAAGVLCAMLGYKRGDFSRFRHACVEMVDGEPQIAIFTRNGGGNRECFSDEEPCYCTGCMMSIHIPQMDGYLWDEDDQCDSTYATIFFKAPEKYRAILKSAAMDEKHGKVWGDFMNALQNPPENPATDAQKRAVELLAAMAPAEDQGK